MTPSRAGRPTQAEIAAAFGRMVPDLTAAGLKVLFCGINPSLYSAAVGHHFARPGNRFWPALYAAGFSDRLLAPSEEGALLSRGYGITNLVARATATAEELAAAELALGARRLKRKLRRLAPACIAFLGMTAYRTAFARKDAVLGSQPAPLAGAQVWVLPNPSGLNAHYQLADLARVYGELRLAAG
jgi:double-stranded uracil-DNA glycosylase